MFSGVNISYNKQKRKVHIGVESGRTSRKIFIRPKTSFALGGGETRAFAVNIRDSRTMLLSKLINYSFPT